MDIVSEIFNLLELNSSQFYQCLFNYVVCRITTYHLNITVVRDDNTKVQTIEKDFPEDIFYFNQTDLENLNLGKIY